MSALLSKDEDLRKSAPVVAAAILRLLVEGSGDRVSIFEVANKLHRQTGGGVRALYYGMLFLYSVGIIDFQEPYIVVVSGATP